MLLKTTIKGANVRLASAILGIGFSALYLYFYANHIITSPICCDIAEYFDYGSEIEANGLWGICHGFRTYMFPLYLSLLPFNLESRLAFLYSFVYIQSLLFLVLSCTVLFQMRKSKYFFPFLVGICINPIVLIYIPLPLTESLVCVVIITLLGIAANIDRIKPMVFLVAAGSVGGSFVAIRPASVSVSAGLLAFCLLYIWRRHMDKMRALAAYKPLASWVMLLSLFVSLAVPISIQYYLNYKNCNKTGLIIRDLGEEQLKWGIEYNKYGTVYQPLNDKFAGMRYETGITPPDDKRYLLFYFRHPVKGLKLALTHIYSALNYDFMDTYVHTKHKRIYFYQILSSLTTILGFLGMGYCWTRNFRRREIPVDLYTLADFLILFSLPVLAVVAVETRYGLIPSMLLSVRAVGLLFEVKNMRTRTMMIFLAVTLAYVVLSVYFSDHLYSNVKVY
ncbi:hypothetical protein ACFL4R_01005 [Nitrospirota bacterium]